MQGETLGARLAAGAVAPDDFRSYAIALASALCDWHRHQAVHGSLHPDRIVFTPAGIVLQKADDSTDEHCPYTAPEQLLGKPADPRSDIFAFGAILCEMVTGRKPPPGETPEAWDDAALGAVIGRCMMREPGERYQSAWHLLMTLKLLGGQRKVPESAGASSGQQVEPSPSAPPPARVVTPAFERGGILECPKCSADDVRPSRTSRPLDLLMKKLARSPYRCRVCGRRFYARARPKSA